MTEEQEEKDKKDPIYQYVQSRFDEIQNECADSNKKLLDLLILIRLEIKRNSID